MKNFVLRLIVTLIVLYGLGAAAYGWLHYPPGERPDVGGVLGDYTRDLGSVFRRTTAQAPVQPSGDAPVPSAPHGSTPGAGDLSSLDDLRGDSHHSLALALIVIPESGRLPVEAAQMWDTLRPIHAKTLPEAIEELGRLRALRSTDRPAFERDREAARAKLAEARTTLVSTTRDDAPLQAAVELLRVLDGLDTSLAGL